MNFNLNIKLIVSVLIIAFLSLVVLNHFFKDLFKLNPFYRNKILLEGFDASGNATTTPAATTTTPAATTTETTQAPQIPETEKSTIMTDLFEKVNDQMDTIRTIKLSDKFVPINIDKTVSDPFLILTNLKLLINNGIYTNEIDLKEMYNKYIGNKAVKLLVSEINSINMESGNSTNIESLETSFLTRCRDIVNGHQKIIDNIIEKNKKV